MKLTGKNGFELFVREEYLRCLTHVENPDEWFVRIADIEAPFELSAASAEKVKAVIEHPLRTVTPKFVYQDKT